MAINFGIIGCGYIGQRHAMHIALHPEATLINVFDIDAARSKIISDEYDASATNNMRELVSNDSINVVSICTPNGNHFQPALEALKSGKHVLIEKPMTLRSDEARELIAEAERRKLRIFVVKQNRFNAPVQALKRLVDENKLGRVFMVSVNCYWNRNELYYQRSDWKGTKALDGGTLFTQFSHFVDIFYYLFGDIADINGIVSNANHQGLIEFEDTGVFTFRFLNGALGSFNYTTNSFEKNMEGSMTVFAENGTIKLGGQYLNKIDYQRTKGFNITNLPESGPANDYGYYQGSMSNHDKVIANVVDALMGRSEAMTSAEDGLKVVDIIERMYAAAKSA